MKTALITGASSGIGKETAFEFAKNNYNLVLVARRLEQLDEIKLEIEKTYKVSVSTISMDLSHLNSAEILYKKVLEKNLKIDVLINNAGFAQYGNFLDIDAEKDEEMLVLNIVSLTKLTRLFANNMLIRGGGNIINLASTAAFQPVPGLATYSASKSYVMNFSEALAYELKDKGIIVTSICPGATQSEFGNKAAINKNVFNNKPTSADLAQFIYKSMLKGKSNGIHGFLNKILAQSNRFSPRKLTTIIAARMMQ